MAKRLKRTVRYLLVRAALGVVSRLPLSFAGRLGEAFGSAGFRFAAKERQKALASLAVAFPELGVEGQARLAKACFRHLGRSAFELACIAQLDVSGWVEWPREDRSLLEETLARGKGVVFVSGHVGSWELLARRVAMEGFACQTIAKETSDPRLTSLVERFRASSGLRSIWRGREGAARHMLRALKSGEVLGLLIDQDTRVQSVFVPFFGKEASTPRAAADLALRTGAAVVLGFCHRVAPERYRISMREVPVPQGAAHEAAVLELTAELTRGIEKAIRLHPEQWVWMHQRWKTRPNMVEPEPSEVSKPA